MSTPTVAGINDRSSASRQMQAQKANDTADKAAAAILSLESLNARVSSLEEEIAKLLQLVTSKEDSKRESEPDDRKGGQTTLPDGESAEKGD